MPVVADIVKIDAPSSAPADQQIIVDVSVKNISTSDQYIAVTAAFYSTSIPFQFDYLLVAPGQTVVMRGWFTMPGRSVQVKVYSSYWTGSEWAQDDEATVDISLAGPFSELAAAGFQRG